MRVDISFIIVNWNTKDLLLQCLSSIYHTVKDISFEVYVVDNGSTDGSTAAARAHYPHIHCVENSVNLGFAAANNLALRHMHGRYALLLNTDATLYENAAHELFYFMEAHPGVAMACGRLFNLDGSKQNAIANYPSLLSLLVNESLLRILLPDKFPSKRKQYRTPIDVESCIGACLLVRKSAIDHVGLLDERYFFFLEETDWAYRMKQAGWRICFVPWARISHAQGKSVENRVDARILFYRSRYAFFKKWHPKTYPFIWLVVFLRLCINLLLSLVAVGFTLGFNKGLNRKFTTYLRLFMWHLRGCP